MIYERLQKEAIHQLSSNRLVAQYYGGKRVLVTGGTGFIGGHVVSLLEGVGATPLVYPRRHFDLTDNTHTEAMFHQSHPVDLVIHLAGVCNGIGETARTPGYSFYQNLQMGVNVIHHAWQFGISKVIVAGSVCAYPRYTTQPMHEGNLWDGLPEETNGPYGIAKRTLHAMLEAYYQQYRFPSVYLLMGNVYGPGDNFDLRTSHVIPALIRKFEDARKINAEAVTIWGSGRVTRDFSYVTDTVRAIVQAGVYLSKPNPINIASGTEIFVSGLAQKIKEITGFTGELHYDISKPDGQPRRSFNITAAKKLLDYKANVTLDDGLKSVLEWYRDEFDPPVVEDPGILSAHII